MSLNLIAICLTVLADILIFIRAYLCFNAFKPLKEKKMSGWIFLFWSNVMDFTYGLLILGTGNTQVAFRTIVISFLGFYLLEKMKSSYRK
jgi:hypothetical protein